MLNLTKNNSVFFIKITKQRNIVNVFVILDTFKACFVLNTLNILNINIAKIQTIPNLNCSYIGIRMEMNLPKKCNNTLSIIKPWIVSCSAVQNIY